MNEKFKPKKKYGQNFITNTDIIDNMVLLSQVDKDTLVIEIGPGEGILTTKLSENAKAVITYEIDKTLESILKSKLQKCNNVELIFDDFVQRDINLDIKKYDYKKLYFVANIPYYITNSIITKLIENIVSFDKIVIMVQKEVGERFSARPGVKAYGSLTVYLNYFYNVQKLFDVKKNNFYPVPKVDSVVISLNKNEKMLVKDEQLFFKLIRDSFVHKRKILKNNLFNYDLDKIDLILKENNLSLNSRAEEISLDIFIKLANELSVN